MLLVDQVIVLVLIGVLLWLVNAYVPADARIKNILKAVVVISPVPWLLRVFGL